jgi:N-acyl-phosphatidylethanolamine-hydrolysing phospholipase D
VFFLFLLTTLCLPATAADAPPHHASKGFANPHAQGAHGSLWRFLRARFSSGEWSDYNPSVYEVPQAKPDIIADDQVSTNAAVTWLGHSTVLIQHRGINVLTDPMLTKRASPVGFAGPKRISPVGLAVDALPRIDAVVISHNHYDHVDVETLKAMGPETRFYVPLGLARWFEGLGIEAERITEMDWWDTTSLETGAGTLQITAAPSQHFSGRGAFDRNASLWASWTIEWSDYKAWYGGDTGYNDVQFKAIGKRFPDIDLAIIPIGAYAPNWFMRAVHVNPTEAVSIHRDLGARRSMAVHWGTFMLSAEPVDEPPRLLAAAVAAADLPADAFTTYAVGETRRYVAQ